MRLQSDSIQDVGLGLKQGPHRDGDTYAGEYGYDKVTETVKGCPGRSPRIRSYLKVIGTKSGEKGSSSATRQHAEAMKLEDLKTLMRWSESEYPSERLEDVPKDVDELMVAVEHGMMRAFMSTGFVLWTRWDQPMDPP